MKESKNKLLILNGSHSEIPLIKAGKNLGFHVITTGNAPSLIGHKYADEYHHADFSDKEEILELATKLGINAICSSANDFGAITASFLAEKMGLPGHDSYDTTLIVHHKDRFKKFSKKHQIQTPYAESFEDENSALIAVNKYSFPLIIKPVDLTGGKGVSKVTTNKEYPQAIKKAFRISRAKRIVVEKYFKGTQHSFSTFIVNRKVAFYFSDNEYSFLNPYLVSTSAAPATNIEKYADGLVASAEQVAEALDLVDGVLHIQYLANEKAYTIIEMTRRCSGDLYPYPVDISSDLDWGSWIVKAETGITCADFPETEQKGYCGRHCIMSCKNGVVKDVVISERLKKYIDSEVVWWEKGDVIDNYMAQKLGVLLLRYPSLEQMHETTKHLNKLVRVSLEP